MSWQRCRVPGKLKLKVLRTFVGAGRAYERFTGPQIAKIALENEQEYKNTERISLVRMRKRTLTSVAHLG